MRREEVSIGLSPSRTPRRRLGFAAPAKPYTAGDGWTPSIPKQLKQRHQCGHKEEQSEIEFATELGDVKNEHNDVECKQKVCPPIYVSGDIMAGAGDCGS